MYDKAQLRKLVKERRGQAAPSDLLHDSYVIFRKIREMEEYITAGVIYGYADFNNEVKTLRFLANCLGDGKQVALPRVEGDQIHFYYIEALKDLKENSMGIKEPGPDAERADSVSALMIMPGIAFDKNRNRIGYGAGYYDRYLAENPFHKTIAVAFEFQIFDEVPHDEKDVRPSILVTEGRTFRPLRKSQKSIDYI